VPHIVFEGLRFFDLLSWMLRSRKLQEFIHKQGGADDQLFGGSKRTSVMCGFRHMWGWNRV